MGVAGGATSKPHQGVLIVEKCTFEINLPCDRGPTHHWCKIHNLKVKYGQIKVHFAKFCNIYCIDNDTRNFLSSSTGSDISPDTRLW
jgi:hypothetical protein